MLEQLIPPVGALRAPIRSKDHGASVTHPDQSTSSSARRWHAARTVKAAVRTVVAAGVVISSSGCGSDGASSGDVQAQNSTSKPSPAAADEIPPAPLGDPCVLDADFLNRTLAPFVGQTSVTKAARTADSSKDVCRYNLGGTGGGTFYLYSQRYRDGRFVTSGVYDVERKFGGYTPSQVYESSIVAIRDVGSRAGAGSGVAEFPDIGGGMVTDSNNEMVLAGTGDYWFQASVSGGPYHPSINDAFVNIGRVLAAASGGNPTPPSSAVEQSCGTYAADDSNFNLVVVSGTISCQEARGILETIDSGGISPAFVCINSSDSEFEQTGLKRWCGYHDTRFELRKS